MKKLLLITLFVLSYLLNAQDKDSTFVYCELIEYTDIKSKKDIIRVKFEDLLYKTKGKTLTEAYNILKQDGWEFEYSYADTVKSQYTFYWILRKKVKK